MCFAELRRGSTTELINIIRETLLATNIQWYDNIDKVDLYIEVMSVHL